MPKVDLIALSLALAVTASAADPPSPAPPATGTPPADDSPAAEASHSVALGSADLRGLDSLLPVGKTARKVIVPSIDETGVLTSVTRMGKITRVDDDVFVLENVRLTTLDPEHPDPETGKPEATVVRISKGEYIASERKLVSNRPVFITKPRLRIMGESLVYWADDGHAVLKGRSETILTGFEAPDTPADTEEPDTEEPDVDPEDREPDVDTPDPVIPVSPAAPVRGAPAPPTQ